MERLTRRAIQRRGRLWLIRLSCAAVDALCVQMINWRRQARFRAAVGIARPSIATVSNFSSVFHRTRHIKKSPQTSRPTRPSGLLIPSIQRKDHSLPTVPGLVDAIGEAIPFPRLGLLRGPILHRKAFSGCLRLRIARRHREHTAPRRRFREAVGARVDMAHGDCPVMSLGLSADRCN